MDETKLNEFVGRMLGDLGGAFSVPMVRIGDRLGLYRTLQESGPMTAAELARESRHRRTLRARVAVASGGVRLSRLRRRRPAAFTLSPEQAMVFAQTDSPVYLQGAFDLAAVMLENQALVEPAFRTGKGVGWGEQSPCLFCTVGRFFRPSYHNALVQSWLPALDGMSAKLERGATVADVGCGHGFSTVIMAKAFPTLDLRRLRLPRRLDRAGAGACRAAWRDGQHTVRGRLRRRLSRQGPRSGDILRLPARHGRSGRRGAACAADAEAGRTLDDRRAAGRRPAGGQPEPGRAGCSSRPRR